MVPGGWMRDGKVGWIWEYCKDLRCCFFGGMGIQVKTLFWGSAAVKDGMAGVI